MEAAGDRLRWLHERNGSAPEAAAMGVQACDFGQVAEAFEALIRNHLAPTDGQPG